MNDVIDRLYASEINWEVSTFWDAGYEVKLGDHMNGYVAEANIALWSDVVDWLDRQARVHYPDSTYGKVVA